MTHKNSILELILTEDHRYRTNVYRCKKNMVFWRRFIVNHRQHRVRFFLGISRCQHRLFFNFADIFLISLTSAPSDFLLKRAVRTVQVLDGQYRLG
jgi:hypothetical protein